MMLVTVATTFVGRPLTSHGRQKARWVDGWMPAALQPDRRFYDDVREEQQEKDQDLFSDWPAGGLYGPASGQRLVGAGPSGGATRNNHPATLAQLGER